MTKKADDNTRKFKVDGKSYKVIRPTNKIRRDSEAVYARAYRKAIQDGFFLDAEIEEVLRNRNMDNKSMRDKKNNITGQIKTLEMQLKNEDFKDKDNGRQLALDIIDLRTSLDELDSARVELNNQSAATHAENQRFSYFAYACCLSGKGVKMWDRFEEFEEDESPLSYRAATELLLLLYETNKEVFDADSDTRVENIWLIENGYGDDTVLASLMEGASDLLEDESDAEDLEKPKDEKPKDEKPKDEKPKKPAAKKKTNKKVAVK